MLDQSTLALRRSRLAVVSMSRASMRVLEVRPEGAIAGTVTIDQPGDADIEPDRERHGPRLRRRQSTRSAWQVLRPAADGSYIVDGLSPGDYYVEAVAIGYLTERFDDIGLGEVLATTVTVVENATTQLDRSGPRTARGHHRCCHGGAGAYVGATEMYCVAATPLAPLSFPTRTSCARIGQPYRISKLPSGSYDVQFTSANFDTTPYTRCRRRPHAGDRDHAVGDVGHRRHADPEAGDQRCLDRERWRPDRPGFDHASTAPTVRT